MTFCASSRDSPHPLFDCCLRLSPAERLAWLPRVDLFRDIRALLSPLVLTLSRDLKPSTMLALLAFPAAFALLPTLAAGAASNKALTAGAGANATSAAASSPSTASSAAAGQSGVSATSTGACANPGPVAGVQGMLKQFPPLYVTAKIVAGDTVAQQLFQSITSNQTYAKALAFPPTVVHDYNPVFTGCA